ncbi:MAG: hypothetical protein ACRDYZ_07520 [Acidimicrobiales bacterium]
MIATVRRGLLSFGRFWVDFLVGDTPELFVAMLVLVGLAFALRHHRTAAVVTLPTFAAVAVLASAFHGRRRRAPPSGSDEKA